MVIQFSYRSYGKFLVFLKEIRNIDTAIDPSGGLCDSIAAGEALKQLGFDWHDLVEYVTLKRRSRERRGD